MGNRKTTGPSVSVWIDGVDGGNSDVVLQCDHIDTQWRCPFALGDIMPMGEGARCSFKNYGECRSAAARLDALGRAKRLAEKKLKELEDDERE